MSAVPNTEHLIFIIKYYTLKVYKDTIYAYIVCLLYTILHYGIAVLKRL